MSDDDPDPDLTAASAPDLDPQVLRPSSPPTAAPSRPNTFQLRPHAESWPAILPSTPFFMSTTPPHAGQVADLTPPLRPSDASSLAEWRAGAPHHPDPHFPNPTNSNPRTSPIPIIVPPPICTAATSTPAARHSGLPPAGGRLTKRYRAEGEDISMEMDPMKGQMATTVMDATPRKTWRDTLMQSTNGQEEGSHRYQGALSVDTQWINLAV